MSIAASWAIAPCALGGKPSSTRAPCRVGPGRAIAGGDTAVSRAWGWAAESGSVSIGAAASRASAAASHPPGGAGPLAAAPA